MYVHCRPRAKLHNDCVQPAVKHAGGQVMVWGHFGGQQTGDFAKIDGKMKKEQYLEILRNHVITL